MAITRFTFRAARGHLDTFDGTELGWLILDPDGAAAAAPSMATVADLTGELSTDDAPDYERGTIAVVWDAELGLLKRDPEAAVPATDTTGGTPRAVVFYAEGATEEDSELVAMLPVPEGPGYADWDIDPAAGIAVADDEADFTLDELADVDTSTDAPTNGQALVWVAADEKWKPGDVAGAGGSGPIVDVFLADTDMAGGAFTEVTLFGATDPIARSFLEDLDVLVVDGDDLGLWTITASGPCTAGAGLVIGETVTSRNGYSGVPWTLDGTTIAAVRVAVTPEEFAALAEEGDELVDEAALLADLEATASARPAPTMWALCGSDGAGHWYCPTLPPVPTTELIIEAWACGVEGDGTSTMFQEHYSIPQDSGGVANTGGVWDWAELAQWLFVGRMVDYWEWTSDGGSSEWHSDGRSVLPPITRSIPPTAWVRRRVKMDLTTGVILLQHESTSFWDEEDAGTRWRTTCTYDTGDPIVLESYTAVEQWVGRGEGLFRIARVRRWDDGVLVVDFDPSTAADGATTIDDAVLESAPGTPAVWTARLDAAVEAAPASDPVPAGRTLAGLDLTADRSASDLRTAIGTGRYLPPAIIAAAGWRGYSSGSAPAPAQSSARWFASYVDLSRTATGGWIEWESWFDAGTWTLRGFYDRLAGNGVCTISIDGVDVGTFDQWNSTTLVGQSADLTGITIATSGLYLIRSTVTAGGNGVSTNASQRWSAFQPIRTA
jgi:hypothetical protein